MKSIISDFIQEVEQSIQNQTFVKMILSKPLSKDSHTSKVHFQAVLIRQKRQVKIVYTHPTQDITQNGDADFVVKELQKYLLDELCFLNANLFTTSHQIQLLINKKKRAKILRTALKTPLTTNSNQHLQHDKQKKQYFNPQSLYLRRLGLSDKNGNIIKAKNDKIKQINKYIETLSHLLKNSGLDSKAHLSIVDMGAGKGYLSFALYDYIKHTLKKEVQMIGVEQRPNLVKLCNGIAKESQWEGLQFVEGTIADYDMPTTDILIALHACDTATDDAIYKGIQAQADLIVTAPCCHKQVRNTFKVEGALKSITQFGILQERQAEILTDSLRALCLESENYKTQVFEFIADAHTHKNVMIVGTKRQHNNQNKDLYLGKIQHLKNEFGLEHQYLEQLLKK